MSQEGSNRKSSHAELLDRCHVPWLKTRAAFGFGRSYDFWAVGKCRAQVHQDLGMLTDADLDSGAAFWTHNGLAMVSFEKMPLSRFVVYIDYFYIIFIWCLNVLK